MGTRSGNIDPALIPFIMQKTGQNAEEVLNVLNKESGLLIFQVHQVTYVTLKVMLRRKRTCTISTRRICFRIHKYIGSYATRMHGVDVIVFTAGVGRKLFNSSC